MLFKAAGKAERFGDTRIELAVDGVARSPIGFGVTQNHANLALAHNADILHADFGILRNLHVGTQADTHHHAVPSQADVLYLTHLDAIDLHRVVEHQCAHLGKAQIERIEGFARVLLVQEEHAEHKYHYSQQYNQANREV